MKGTLYGVGVGPGQTLKKPLPIKLQYRQFRSWKKKNFFQSTCR